MSNAELNVLNDISHSLKKIAAIMDREFLCPPPQPARHPDEAAYLADELHAAMKQQNVPANDNVKCDVVPGDRCMPSVKTRVGEAILAHAARTNHPVSPSELGGQAIAALITNMTPAMSSSAWDMWCGGFSNGPVAVPLAFRAALRAFLEKAMEG